QPLAAKIAGMSCVAIEIDPSRIQKRLDTKYVDERIDDLGAAIEKAKSSKEPITIAVCMNAAHAYPEIVRRGIVPDLVTEQTSAHDPLNGYVPSDLPLKDAEALRVSDPVGYV